MEDRNCEILFEYLRSILYDDKIRDLDTEQLDEDFVKLGMGLQYLAQAVKEMKDYSGALSVGNLSVTPPPRENFLCENLKNIHSSLNHLTWQAKQVAKGDYSQNVSFLGEFSEAFNTMTRQLSERENDLKEEAEIEREKEKKLQVEAHQDGLTGIGNRHYFFKEAEKLLAGNEHLILCYCDLDHLKYVNDNFGHSEGDWYIKHFTELVLMNIRKDDIFARIGGDEFCIIFRGCSHAAAEKKMNLIQEQFGTAEEKPYPKNFSYGIVEIEETEEAGYTVTAADVVSRADIAMYEQKKLHRQSGPVRKKV